MVVKRLTAVSYWRVEESAGGGVVLGRKMKSMGGSSEDDGTAELNLVAGGVPVPASRTCRGRGIMYCYLTQAGPYPQFFPLLALAGGHQDRPPPSSLPFSLTNFCSSNPLVWPPKLQHKGRVSNHHHLPPSFAEH